MLPRWVSFIEASRRTGFNRERIASMAKKGWLHRHPMWDRQRKLILIVKRQAWYLAAPPPSPEWNGKPDPAGDRIFFMATIPQMVTK